MVSAEQLNRLRWQLAEVQRDYSPDQPRDGRGRFAPGGGGEKKADASHMASHAPGQHISEHGETPRPIADQCSNCGKIRSSWHPLAGQRVPDDPSEARSHGGFCPECQKHYFIKTYLPYLLDRQHMTREEGMVVIDQLIASVQHQFAISDAAKAQQYQQWLSEQEQSSGNQRMQTLRRLAARLDRILTDLHRAA